MFPPTLSESGTHTESMHVARDATNTQMLHDHAESAQVSSCDHVASCRHQYSDILHPMPPATSYVKQVKQDL
jgi:hypothetical protein